MCDENGREAKKPAMRTRSIQKRRSLQESQENRGKRKTTYEGCQGRAAHA
jgi:hypothetical protein